MNRLLPKNEHAVDRAARLVIGFALVSLSLWGPHTLWGLIGLVPIVTGLVGSCPIYTLAGLSSRTAKQSS